MNNRYEDRVHKFNAEQLVLGMQRMPGVLRGLGYTSLREGQQKIISCVMGGQDTLGVLPTSEGKTLSFVAPTLALKWRTLVFSPLISLIRDQQQQYTIRGARVGALTSHNSDAMNMEFLSQWVRGGMDLMYVAPERLMRPEFQEAMRIAPPHMTVVDECFTPDVEILTEDGWVRFDQLEKGRKVAQVDPVDRGITFTTPTEYIQKPHKGRMVRVKSHRLCDLTMTPEHELLVQWPSGWRKQAVDKVRFNNTKKMAAAGFGRGTGSALLTPRERLLIAYQADGNLHRDRSAAGMSTLAFSFTRERKLVRFLQLMEDGGFDWSEVADRDGRRRFLVKNVPTVTKRLSDHFKLEDMSVARARAFVAEAVEWDGSKISKKLHYYSCTVKPNTDFVQAVCVLAGYKTNEVMQEDNREPQFNDVYRLFISLETSTFGTGQLEKYDEMYDGDVYCVRVPKGCIVVRRNGKPVIIGNCHCLSGWSDTFRSAYCVIGDFITAFNPEVVLALTATCPPQVEADVRRVLCIQQGVKVLHYPRRKNLDLRSSAWNGLEGLASLLSRKPVEGAAVVYCATQKGTEMTAAALQEMMAKEVLFYHGGLTPASRSSIQDRFMNEPDVIMCATNAFGMGVDKAQPLSAKVLTPAGFRTMGSLMKGDQVIGQNGKPTRILDIHERGFLPAFKVEFSDGTSTICADDHRWAVRTPKEKYCGKEFTVRNLEFLRQKLRDSSGNSKWFIPIVEPVEFMEKSLPISPYLLGVLLGDGCLTVSTHFVSKEGDMPALVQDELPEGVRMVTGVDGYVGLGAGRGRKNPLTEALRDLGLMGCKSQHKFIPELYRNASVDQRLAVLQGLLDTDGHVPKPSFNTVVYVTTSNALCDDVAWIVRSLGGVATYAWKGSGWYVYIRLPNSMSPFRRPRKRDAYRPRTKYHPTHCIEKVEALGDMEMRCITVENADGLYVTDDFIVTHNSDVRMVVHKDMAGSIEAQAQEEGRGGRDGKYTLCHTFSDPESVRTHKFLIACSNPTFEDVSRVYQALVKNKDLEGKVMLTKDELAKRAGLKGFGMDAVMQVLKGAQVIESTKNERKEHLVRVKNMTDDPKLKDFMAAVRSCAVPASDNGYSFVLQDLEDLLGVSEAVLKSRMRDWAKGGLIQHAPPERANPVKVVGSLRQVDAERVDGLRARAEAKLAVVRKYVDEVPDNEKHAFIEQCMGVT